MYDKGKVLAGLAIFVLLMASPIWLNFAIGVAEPPKPEKPVAEKECIRDAAEMRKNHMQILEDWRHSVVRSEERDDVYMGKTHKKSLTNTCLRCHSNKEKFCDRCHIYAGVAPYCFTCHVDPKERT